MKIKVDKFCSLSTSPSWQAWLFHFDVAIYRRFMRQLQESRGCNQNRDIMVELLKEVEKVPEGVEKLFGFLEKHYPHMIVREASAQRPEPKKQTQPVGPVFQQFNPNILTYPRRQILDGDDLKQRVQEFMLDKIKGDFVIVDGKAYVEFLERVDVPLAEKIPAKNWQIAAWRLRQT